MPKYIYLSTLGDLVEVPDATSDVVKGNISLYIECKTASLTALSYLDYLFVKPKETLYKEHEISFFFTHGKLKAPWDGFIFAVIRLIERDVVRS